MGEVKIYIKSDIPPFAVGQGIKDEYLVIRYPLSDVDEEDMKALSEIVNRIETKRRLLYES